MYADKAVEFLFSLFLKLLLWFLYLVLNSFEVDPMYSIPPMEALYTTHEDLHLLGKMHSFLQLHGGVSFPSVLSLIFFWLCALIMDAMFAVQL